LEIVGTGEKESKKGCKGVGRDGKGKGVREREGKKSAKRGGRAQLGYLSIAPEFLVTPLMLSPQTEYSSLRVRPPLLQ